MIHALLHRNPNDMDIELGIFIYFVLIHCNVGDIKVFLFYKNLLESKNLPSVVQTVKNSIDLEESDETRKLHKAFFEDLVNILDMDLKNIMLTMLTATQLRDQDLLNLDHNMTLTDLTAGLTHN